MPQIGQHIRNSSQDIPAGTSGKNEVIVNFKGWKLNLQICYDLRFPELIKNELISDFELQKVKNKLEASNTFSETSILNNAINLAIAESLGDANMVNLEKEIYAKISAKEIHLIAQENMQRKRSSTLYYRSNQKKDATK